jgi:hypothetical protein
LRFAVIIIVVVISSATATVLLTLPHGLPFMLADIDWRRTLISATRGRGSFDPIQKI